MARNLMTLASRTMSMFHSNTARPRRQRSGMCLENLEARLSLSAFATKAAASIAAPADIVSLRKHVSAEVSVTPSFRVGSHIGTG